MLLTSQGHYGDSQALENADFVIEAINEDEALKKGTFRLLDRVRFSVAHADSSCARATRPA
jgi:3-hydroxyacyl-CoA dehydrogenase